MTEKRFVGGSYGFYDRYKDDRLLWSEWEEIIPLMNNLDEKARERSKALSKLQKENEQLVYSATVLIQANKDYRKENELLKEALREELQDNGNKYYIELFDDLFDLDYDEWRANEEDRPFMNWEKLHKEKINDLINKKR